jgi:hypothetical protein|tara:strand:+ start:140 stop:451 length:312 start_codon:yes stop_codon:yes gene_type:complete
MDWEEIINQHEDDIGEMILKELKKGDHPSGDFQHEVTEGVSVRDFNDEYIEINILQERVSNWTEWSEHFSLTEYRMRILNRPKTKDDDYTIWGYPMVDEYNFV